MKRYFQKTSGLAALILLLGAQGFAQQTDTADTDGPAAKVKEFETIIIQRKTTADTKVTVEIKNGKVLINGKPSNEYKDANVTVSRIRNRDIGGRSFSITTDDGDGSWPAPPPAIAFAPSPFRNHSGTFSFNGDDWDSKDPRAFLGVTSEKPDDKDGASVTGVSKGSAAEKAGLKTGDLITRIDEIKITDPDALVDAIHKYKPEDKVTVTFSRDGKEQKVTTALGKSKVSGMGNFRYSMPRLKNLDIAPYGEDGYPGFYGNSRAKLGIKAQDVEEGKGVKVLEVGDESPAEKAGIKEGDIITHFDGKEIGNATELGALARSSRDKSLYHVKLIRDGKSMELDIKIPKKLKTADL